MKVFTKMILGVVTVLSLANCKVTADGKTYDVDVECASEGSCDPTTGDPVSESITYFEGGWYPGPGRANFSLDLTLSVRADLKIKLNAKTPDCENSAIIGLSDYMLLENALLRARTELGKSNGVDRGDEYMNLNMGSGRKSLYLSEGDSTYKKPVVIEQDAKKIHVLLDKILDRAFPAGICDRILDFSNSDTK